jgi:hypothetical protein
MSSAGASSRVLPARRRRSEMAKNKRGRLSSIDLLPEQAEPHVLAALKGKRCRAALMDWIDGKSSA